MIQPIDIYNDARRKIAPIDSLRYTIIDIISNDIELNLNYTQLTGSLILSARSLELCILELVSGCLPDKAIIINQQIEVTSTHLARYIGWDVVNKFIYEQSLTTGRIGASHGL